MCQLLQVLHYPCGNEKTTRLGTVPCGHHNCEETRWAEPAEVHCGNCDGGNCDNCYEACQEKFRQEQEESKQRHFGFINHLSSADEEAEQQPGFTANDALANSEYRQLHENIHEAVQSTVYDNRSLYDQTSYDNDFPNLFDVPVPDVVPDPESDYDLNHPAIHGPGEKFPGTLHPGVTQPDRTWLGHPDPGHQYEDDHSYDQSHEAGPSYAGDAPFDSGYVPCTAPEESHSMGNERWARGRRRSNYMDSYPDGR